MAMPVDAKLLRTTKFPPEFNQKVDMQKVNVDVMKKWIARTLSELLGVEDDVVIELCFNLLEGSRFPNIKELQIQLTGFLDKDTPKFCKDLWQLCLNAQSSPHGVPQELLEAKKQELMQEKAEAEKAAQVAQQRKTAVTSREKNIDDIRNRERGERGQRGLHARDLRHHDEIVRPISQLRDEKLTPTSLEEEVVTREETTDAEDLRQGPRRCLLLLDHHQEEAGRRAPVDQGLLRANNDVLLPGSAMDLQNVVGERMVIGEEIGVLPILRDPAHHLLDHDIRNDEIILLAEVRLQNYVGEEDRHRHRLMTRDEEAEAEGTGEGTGEHLLLLPSITGAVDVLTLSGPDPDETTHA
ncbi:hypothetical protein PMZ80_006059 [Knufia obscura]|uniref:PWI domain-containing protein n=1 Tax=Knufia obscura TaxID=1635080 RepID=A0ABR0RNB5_9EURO|nr:hypothetical protein PMZ80_006059 [Knufia obscura]